MYMLIYISEIMIKYIKKFYRENKFFVNFFILWCVFFFFMRILQHYSFRTGAWDLSIFDYSMYFSLKGHIMYEPFHNYGWGSHFGVHFTPILLLFVPLYIFLKGPLFLLFIQVLAVGFSSFFLYLIARKIFNDNTTPVIIVVVYLIYRPLINGMMYDFHPEMLFPLFIFASYYFLEVREIPSLYYLFIVLSVMIKEDYILYVLFYGIFLIIFKKKKEYGIITSLFSIVYAGLVFGYIIPYFRNINGINEQYEFLSLWKDYGNNIWQILFNILSKPLEFFGNLGLKETLASCFNVFSTLLFIPLFSGFILIGVFIIFIDAVSRIPAMKTLGLHYISSLIPFLFLSFIYGLKRIKDKCEVKNKSFIFRGFLILLLIINIFNTKWNLLDLSKYKLIKDHEIISRYIDKIPLDSSIASQNVIIPHIPKRKNIKIIPEIDNVDYIIIHTQANPWPISKIDLVKLKNSVFANKDYKCLSKTEHIFLFKRKTKQQNCFK